LTAASVHYLCVACRSRWCCAHHLCLAWHGVSALLLPACFCLAVSSDLWMFVSVKTENIGISAASRNGGFEKATSFGAAIGLGSNRHNSGLNRHRHARGQAKTTRRNDGVNIMAGALLRRRSDGRASFSITRLSLTAPACCASPLKEKRRKTLRVPAPAALAASAFGVIDHRQASLRGDLVARQQRVSLYAPCLRLADVLLRRVSLFLVPSPLSNHILWVASKSSPSIINLAAVCHQRSGLYDVHAAAVGFCSDVLPLLLRRTAVAWRRAARRFGCASARTHRGGIAQRVSNDRQHVASRAQRISRQSKTIGMRLVAPETANSKTPCGRWTKHFAHRAHVRIAIAELRNGKTEV